MRSKWSFISEIINHEKLTGFNLISDGIGVVGSDVDLLIGFCRGSDAARDNADDAFDL